MNQGDDRSIAGVHIWESKENVAFNSQFATSLVRTN